MKIGDKVKSIHGDSYGLWPDIICTVKEIYTAKGLEGKYIKVSEDPHSWWHLTSIFIPYKEETKMLSKVKYYLNIYKSLTNDKLEKEELTKLMEESK